MSSRNSGTGSKYVLMYYMARHPESAIPHHPPHETLEGALALAWHNYEASGQNESIVHGQRIIFDREDLRRACARIVELLSEQPDRHLIDIAEQVIREMGKQQLP